MNFDEILRETTEKLGPLKTYISKNYSKGEISQDLDDEMLNWIDYNWKEDGDYENKHEWYIDYGHGEAENEIIERIIKEVKSKLNVELTFDEHVELYDWMKNKYNLDAF